MMQLSHTICGRFGGRILCAEFLGLRWATLSDKYLFTTLISNRHLSGSMAFYPWKPGNASKIEYLDHLLQMLDGP